MNQGFGTRARNVASTCQAGDIVVPLCADLGKRRLLAERGIYPGVEYLICDLRDAGATGESFATAEVGMNLQEQPSLGTKTAQDRIAAIRPAYPLRAHLERPDWPVTVQLSDVPLWLSKTTYEAGTALGTLMLAGSYLAMASLVATIVRIAVIPSESMMPALIPGDRSPSLKLTALILMKVVLVTRSVLPPKVGDVVFFDPPPSIDEAVANSKIGRATKTASADVDGSPTISVVSTKGKQFIKRVVAVPGDNVGVYKSNPYVALCNKNTNECKFRVDRTGEYSKPDIFPDESWNRVTPTINANLGDAEDKERTSVLGKNEYFVAGDNGFRSVDSRVWGPLDRQYIFGTAQYILFPPAHFGRIANGNMAITDVLQ
ncbi:hypothetical protein HJC23_008513 [Cyclotella cryptica]|uniref:Mitochondrial inner membrane protease subunit n=1 Tax=Cyclotella cryptica TaxID=29204 RepID=A0ABD3QWW9_9STRA